MIFFNIVKRSCLYFQGAFYNVLGLIVCFSLIPYCAQAQADNTSITLPQYSPKSPAAYAFAQYVDFPVSLYTGTPNVTIPIYELKTGNYTLPITLSYHASGIKVAQEATCVGLGWNLNVCGMISRTIKCGDDFHETSNSDGLNTGYLSAPAINPNGDYDGKQQLQELIDDNKILMVDSEPDIFFYSLPDANGKFILKKDSVPLLFDKKPIVDIWFKNARTEGWTDNCVKFFARTADGTTYVFDKLEETNSFSAESSLSAVADNGEDFVAQPYNVLKRLRNWMQYTSSWYPSKIITTGNDTIYFDYEQEWMQLPLQEAVRYNNLLRVLFEVNEYSLPIVSGLEKSTTKTTVKGYRLNRIRWRGGHADLSYSSRQDMVAYGSGNGEGDELRPKKLDAFKVFDNDGNFVKHISFTYDYFNSTYIGSYPQVYKRLKLTDVTDVLNDGTKYTFDYFYGTLPAKNSHGTDYWGYANGRNYGDLCYSATVYGGRMYQGADKMSSFNNMIVGTLKSVTYPTGGTTTFTFEANTRIQPASQSSHITNVMNVLTSYKGNDSEYGSDFPTVDTDTITLNYATAIKSRLCFEDVDLSQYSENLHWEDRAYPVLIIYKLVGGIRYNYRYFYLPHDFVGRQYYYEDFYIDLEAGTYIFRLESVNSGLYCEFQYKHQVTVNVYDPEREIETGGFRIKRVAGAKTVDYTYDDGQLIVEPIASYVSTKMLREDVTPVRICYASFLTQTSEPVMPLSSVNGGYTWGFGEVTETFSDGTRNVYTYHNEPETRPEYPYVPTEMKPDNGLLLTADSYDANNNILRSESNSYNTVTSSDLVYAFVYKPAEKPVLYSYQMRYPYQESSEVCEDGRTVSTAYTYNENLLKRTETVTDSDSQIATSYKYCTDFSDNVHQLMSDRFMVGIPVETTLSRNGSYIRGKKTEYGSFNGMLLPSWEYGLETTVPLSLSNYADAFRQRLQFTSYNDYGLPGQTIMDGSSTAYLWGYNNTQLIAEIKNASYQQVQTILGSTFIEAVGRKSTPTDADMAAIRNIQNVLPGSMVTTYTYKPLVGVASTTDPRGFTTYFNYDSAGRLAESYFMDGNVKSIIRNYQYNYSH